MTKRTRDTESNDASATASINHSVFIDRLEGSLAVVTFSSDDKLHLNLPLECLPAGVKEGDHLQLTLQLDPTGTEAVGRRIAKLQAELTSSSEDQTNIKI